MDLAGRRAVAARRVQSDQVPPFHHDRRLVLPDRPALARLILAAHRLPDWLAAP